MVRQTVETDSSMKLVNCRRQCTLGIPRPLFIPRCKNNLNDNPWFLRRCGIGIVLPRSYNSPAHVRQWGVVVGSGGHVLHTFQMV